ncbi:MAG TPA: DNA-directed RNA polymerase subunit D, partial [Candidatus Aenigmarchaeota archaeon]|nr:DNA-directed RNA polymerase subunit D [Candidatus Aenigmarchaeota archaeon]HEX32809.1 DNA-directed RNA polymerase subunit D [Candidatus Aenigmarchaeota archaeon]
MTVVERKVEEEEGGYKMKVETIEESDDKLVLVISKVTPGFVNAVRRSVINEVPVLAIEKVFISKNSSAMYDEILAHRLGLIPLITPSGYSYDKRDAPANQVRVTLKKQGPATVYSGDLEFSDPEVKPVFDNIPIVELLNNQEIELEAVAIMGKGREHAKWSPGIAYHKNYPKIKIERNCKAAVDACPK